MQRGRGMRQCDREKCVAWSRAGGGVHWEGGEVPPPPPRPAYAQPLSP